MTCAISQHPKRPRRQAQSVYDTYAQAQGGQQLPSDQQPGFLDRLMGAFTNAPLDSTSRYAGAAPGAGQLNPGSGNPISQPAAPAAPSAFAAPQQDAPGFVPAAGPGPAPIRPETPRAPAGPLPSFAAAGGAPGQDNVSKALSFYQSKGLSPIAASALVGGFGVESGKGLNTNATAIGDGSDGSNSVGIGQWNGARTQGLRQFAASNGLDPSDINTQLQYSWLELNGPEKGTLQALQSAQNPLQATAAALGYERPAGWTAQNPLGAKTFGSRLQNTVALASNGFNTPFSGQPIGPNPSAFTPPPPQDPGLPTMAASGMGMQLPNATPFPMARMSPPAARLASSSAVQPIQPDPGGDNTPGQPTSLASTGSSPGSTQQVTGAPPSQPYGSVPLNVGGQMLTRQQAENADGFDHTDYDAAAAKAGLIPSAATAPPFGDGAQSGVAPSSSSRGAGTAVALSPAPPPAVSPPPAAGAPTSSNAAFSITPTMIGALIKNPDTQQFGLQLWQHMLTTKSQPQIAHSGDWILDANGRPLYQIPNKPDVTDAIKNYQFAASQGYSGGFTQYQADQQKADKAQLVDIPLPNGQFQKAWALPGQNPTPANYVGTPYTRQPANQVTIDQKAESSQEGEYGKAVGQEIGETVKAGASAPQALNQIAMMRAAAARAGDNLSTGPFGPWTLKAKQAISNALGIDIPGTSEGEVINNIGYGLATQAARAISNRPTQFKFGQALAVKPGLSLSPQGMQAVLNIREQDLHDQVALAKLANVRENRDNWAAVKADYYDQHPVMSPFDPSQPLGAGDVQAINDSVQGRQPQSIGAQEASALPVVSSPEAAARLKPGTMFKTPDGRIKQR